MSWAAFAVVRGALEELTIWDVEETRMQYLYYIFRGVVTTGSFDQGQRHEV